jgi:heme exporter protein B
MSFAAGHILTCLSREWRSEWRNKNTIAASLLFVVATAYLIYFSFKIGRISVAPPVWVSLYWMVLLFSSLSVMVKTFAFEERGMFYFSYPLFHPMVLVFSKWLVQSIQLLFVSGIALLLFQLLLSSPPEMNWAGFLVIVASGSIGFAATLTMIAGIAARTENSSLLLSILSLPLLLPQLSMVIKGGFTMAQGFESSLISDELIILWGLNLIALSLNLALFSYIWRR